MLQPYSYPIISKGISSNNYKIEKLTEESCSDILYDCVNNYFIVLFEEELIKLDSAGNEAYKIPMDDCYLSCTSHYVFSGEGVIDLSKNSIVYEEFANILNADFSLKLSELREQFNKLYNSASVVTYDDHYYDGVGYDKAYFKIKGFWVILYVNEFHYKGLIPRPFKNKKGNVIFNRMGMQTLTINGMAEKSNRLLLLKDSKKGRYSNRTTTDDSELYPNYCARFPFPDDYLQCKRIELGYSDIKIQDRLPYIGIPTMWRTTANYKLKMEQEVFKFKCLAYKGHNYIFSSSGMYWFRLPTKFKEASKVSFIRVSRTSNAFNESDFTGLYIIKKKQ